MRNRAKLLAILNEYEGKTLRGLARREEYALFLSATSFLEKAPLPQRVWHIKNGVEEVPTCAEDMCEEVVKWDVGTAAYRKFCSRTCCLKNGETQAKIREALIKKYGVDNPGKSKEVARKKAKTWESRYGVNHPWKSPEVRAKCNATNRERFGHDWPQQSSGFKEKARRTNVARYGVENAAQAPEIQRKMKETCRERYGCDHASQSSEFRKRVHDTCLEKFGYATNLQSPDTKDKIARTNVARYGAKHPMQSKCIQEKARQTNITKFGTSTFSQSLMPEESRLKLKNEDWLRQQHEIEKTPLFEISEMLRVASSTVSVHARNHGIKVQRFSKSKQEKEVFNFIRSIYNGEIIQGTRCVIHPYELDIYLPEIKLAVEYHGLFWHSETVRPQKEYHQRKLQDCEAVGVRLIQIWENEWTHKREIVQSRLKADIGGSKAVHANKTRVVKVGPTTEERFLQACHIQGYVPSKVAYGLAIGKKLYCLMTFGKPEYDRSADWEILRFSTRKGYTVQGSICKLIEHFRKRYNGSIVSYCDLRWDTKDMYKTLGFTYSHRTQPNYWYFKGSHIFSRETFQEHRLENMLDVYDPEHTEYQNMQDNGFGRIWDCGNDVFKLIAGGERNE